MHSYLVTTYGWQEPENGHSSLIVPHILTEDQINIPLTYGNESYTTPTLAATSNFSITQWLPPKLRGIRMMVLGEI
jgi:hypothetical protein